MKMEKEKTGCGFTGLPVTRIGLADILSIDVNY
jgi:hypothetical protein